MFKPKNYYSQEMLDYIEKRIGDEVSDAKVAREIKKIFQVDYTIDSIRKRVERARKKNFTVNREKVGFRRMFFDIETSPNIGLFWKSGYRQTITPESIIKERAIICICWKWEGEKEVNYLTWDHDQDDKTMLEEFAQEIKKADEIVAHNGDRFDIKWFNTRCLYHRINILSKYKTLDTLKKSKQQFYFNSNKLDYIAKFLGVEGKTETGGLDLWKNILLYKDENSLIKIVKYCMNDVIILEKVYSTMKSYITGNSHVGVKQGEEKWSCPNCGSKNVHLENTTSTRMGTVQAVMGCSDCKSTYKVSNKTYMKFFDYKIKQN